MLRHAHTLHSRALLQSEGAHATNDTGLTSPAVEELVVDVAGGRRACGSVSFLGALISAERVNTFSWHDYWPSTQEGV